MRSRLKSVLNNLSQERGSIFPMVLILLVLSALLVPALLGLVRTGIVSGTMYQEESKELYAADAGVMDAMWLLGEYRNGGEEFEDLLADFESQLEENGKYTWELPDPVNGKTVRYEITIDDVDTDIYIIKSTATAPDGASTTIEVWARHFPPDPILCGVAALDGDLVLNSAELGSEYERVDIYANGDIYIRGGSQVYGNAYRTPPHAVNVDNNSELHGEKRLTGSLDIYSDFGPVDPLGATKWPGNMVDNDIKDMVANGETLGPIHITGDLSITGAVAELTGTVWVEGKVKITGGALYGWDDSDPEEYPDGKPYFIVSEDDDSNGNAFSVSGNPANDYEYMVQAILYSPNGSIYVSGDSALDGSVIGKEVDIKGSSRINNDLQLEASPFGPYPMEILIWKIY